MKEEDIEKMILETAIDSKMPCKDAMKIAAKAGIPTQQMAKLLDKHKIKIVSCQLGCF